MSLAPFIDPQIVDWTDHTDVKIMPTFMFVVLPRDKGCHGVHPRVGLCWGWLGSGDYPQVPCVLALLHLDVHALVLSGLLWPVEFGCQIFDCGL